MTDRPLHLAYDARLPPRPSGVGVYTRELLWALARQPDLPLTAVCAPDQPLPGGVERLETPIAFDAHGPAELFEHVQLPRLLEARGVDAFHGPNTIVPSGPSRFRRTVTLHDVAFARFGETLPPAFRLLMRVRTEASLRLADRAVCVSAFTADEVRALFPRQAFKVVAVPSAVPGEAAAHRVEPARQARLLGSMGLERERYVCAIGTLEPRKNLPMLLRAFARARVPGLRLALVGDRGWRDGPLRDALAATPPESVVLTGWLADEQVRDLVEGSAALLYPSLYEGFGFPPLEALALGTRVAAADLPPVRAGCGDRARLLPPSDEDAWVRALSEVSDAPRPAPWVGRTFDDVAAELVALIRSI